MSLKYWQSLDQLANSPETIERLQREFPAYDPDQLKSLSRRTFVKLMSASMALAGLTLTGCRRWPKEELAPFAANPRQRIPGIPEQYATVYEINGVGHGLLVTSYDGRPIKVEGNPSHPMSQTFDGKLGAADAFAQASVLELYDPHRSRSVVDRTGKRPVNATWNDFAGAIQPMRTTGGRGLAILSEKSSSPSGIALRQRLMQIYPQAVWYEYEPLSSDNQQAALGGNFRTQLHLDKADAIVSLDADILGSHPAHLRYAADWAQRRRSADSHGGMSRLYIVESSLTLTGAAADERLAARAARIPLIAAAMASGNTAGLNPDESQFVTQASADLKRNGLIVAGEHLSPAVHAAVHSINSSIGAYGKTVDLLDVSAPSSQPIAKLSEQIKNNGVATLLILGGNPVFDAPVDLDFGKLVDAVPTSIHLSLHDNETSVRCKWHLPRAHYLESWGDARAWDGTISIQQPLILPLFDGKSVIEVLALICDESVTDGRAIVKQTFAATTGNDSETAFRRVLHDGILPDSQFKTATAKPQAASDVPAAASSGFELRFLADRKVLDGRFAANGWLQELPDPLTKLTWDNAALISKKDADSLGVGNGNMIRIGVGPRSLEIVAYILPGQPIGVIGLPLGYGRSVAGNVGTGVGFNTYTLRSSDALDVVANATVTKTGATYPLAQTQEHHLIDSVGFKGREERVGTKGHSGPIIHDIPLSEFEKTSQGAGEVRSMSLPILSPPNAFNTPHAWGMAIDMNICTGCSGCVVACQAENNIPIVGKEQVINGREMHWLRIDRYFKGEMDDPNPDLVYQPMMCVQCENAPCEQVCPVGATVHDTEGINTMVYNRCIGTRYCSNNCPYKVRRFNYFDWHSKAETNLNGAGKPWLGMPDSQQQTINDIRRMVFNPEVTVRMRGVMEKCTYCVQRIHNTQTAKRNVGDDVKDGDIVTACQQACPTEAIVFGDLNDPNSKVSKLHQNARAYSVLDDLNTKPRTKHLAKLRNPTNT